MCAKPAPTTHGSARLCQNVKFSAWEGMRRAWRYVPSTLKVTVRSSRVFAGLIDLAHASGSNCGRGFRKARVYRLLIWAFA